MSRVLLVHLADLHLGTDLLGTKVGTGLSAGLNGHSVLLCEMLQSAMIALRKKYFDIPDGEPLHFVVTGDYARTGAYGEFYLAYEFLRSSWSFIHLHRHDACGLEIPAVHGGNLYSVPGNHDHWNGHGSGIRPPAYNAGVFPNYFDATPQRYIVPVPGQAFGLELFTVDSNEGLRNQSHNLWAAGLLSPAELQGLDAKLRASKTEQAKDKMPRMRAILCHHGFDNNGGLLSASPLAPQSVQALVALAHQHDVAAILTGHTHYFEARAYPHPRTGVNTWELRSAATLQMAPQPAPQGFWVHEIEAERQAPTWTAWQFEWDGLSQFARRYPAVMVR
jgi:3',5'-cyclic AMP phosphodiesterase CpdA